MLLGHAELQQCTGWSRAQAAMQRGRARVAGAHTARVLAFAQKLPFPLCELSCTRSYATADMSMLCSADSLCLCKLSALFLAPVYPLCALLHAPMSLSLAPLCPPVPALPLMCPCAVLCVLCRRVPRQPHHDHGRFSFTAPPELTSLQVNMPVYQLPELPQPDQPLPTARTAEGLTVPLLVGGM